MIPRPYTITITYCRRCIYIGIPVLQCFGSFRGCCVYICVLQIKILLRPNGRSSASASCIQTNSSVYTHEKSLHLPNTPWSGVDVLSLLSLDGVFLHGIIKASLVYMHVKEPARRLHKPLQVVKCFYYCPLWESSSTSISEGSATTTKLAAQVKVWVSPTASPCTKT